MANAAEIERVKTLLRHAQQQSGDSNQANERIKSLSDRLEALQRLEEGNNTSLIEMESNSEEANSEEANSESDTSEEQSVPEQLDS